MSYMVLVLHPSNGLDIDCHLPSSVTSFFIDTKHHCTPLPCCARFASHLLCGVDHSGGFFGLGLLTSGGGSASRGHVGTCPDQFNSVMWCLFHSVEGSEEAMEAAMEAAMAPTSSGRSGQKSNKHMQHRQWPVFRW